MPTPVCSRLHYILEHDGKQAEWVVVAFEAGESNMIEVIRSGRDPHIATAHAMWGISEAAIRAEAKAVGKTTSPGEIVRIRGGLIEQWPELARLDLPRTASLRQGGKVDNHAGNYGEGPITYAEANGVAIREAKLRLYRYNYVVYPGLPPWREEIQFRLRNDHFIVNALGRKIPILGPVHGKSAEATFRQGYAASAQSVVHDIVMGAQPAILDLPHVLLKSDNHDSNATQHWIDPREDREVCAARMLAANQTITDLMTVPLRGKNDEPYTIEIEAKVGLNWGENSASNPWGLRDLPLTMEASLEAVDWLISSLEKK